MRFQNNIIIGGGGGGGGAPIYGMGDRGLSLTVYLN